jgi:hypothetical protein
MQCLVHFHEDKLVVLADFFDCLVLDGWRGCALTRHLRKCQICDCDESATAHTLFHKCKTPLVKAFWMAYMISTLKKGLSTCEIKRQLKITQKTALFWKRKIQQAMKSTELHLLSGVVEVDEMPVDGPEEGKPRRSKGKKK